MWGILLPHGLVLKMISYTPDAVESLVILAEVWMTRYLFPRVAVRFCYYRHLLAFQMNTALKSLVIWIHVSRSQIALCDQIQCHRLACCSCACLVKKILVAVTPNKECSCTVLSFSHCFQCPSGTWGLIPLHSVICSPPQGRCPCSTVSNISFSWCKDTNKYWHKQTY